MKVIGSAAMKEADRKTIEEIGMPGAVLMETAALRVIEFILANQPGAKSFVVLAGPGNNGGDGLAIARLLNNAGFSVSLWSTVKPGAYRGDAGINEKYLEKVSFKINRILDQSTLDQFKKELEEADLVIDALLGIGVDREVEGLMANLIESINNSTVPVVSVDIPSGINADNGEVMGCAVRADWTVTFTFPKIGLLCYQGAEYAGEIYIAQINIPYFLVDHEAVDLLTAGRILDMLPSRPRSAHKGNMGRVLLVAGSPGMSGAAVLAGESALMGGAGLVYLAAAQSLSTVIGAKLVEVITISLPEVKPGIISPGAAEQLLEKAGSCDVLAAGPGLDPGEETTALLKKLIKKSPVPVVIDAGALGALSGKMDLLKEALKPPVLTPHPGEMARLIGASVQEVQNNRLQVALDYARIWNSIIILKGFNTIIAFPDGRAAINPTGGPSLATAGSGDLLTGLIASFISQGMTVENAAAAAVFIHGLAGDIVPAGRGHMAGDILYCYKQAFQYLEKASEKSALNPYLLKVRPY